MCCVVVTLPPHNSVDLGSIPKVGAVLIMVFVVSHETALHALGLRQMPGQYLYKSATTAHPSQPFPSLSPVRDKGRA